MSTEYMEKALTEVRQQIATLQDVEESLSAALGKGAMHKPATRAPRSFATTATAGVSTGRNRKPMSDESKQKIRDAQARRWADSRAAVAAAGTQVLNPVVAPKPELAPTAMGVKVSEQVAAMSKAAEKEPAKVEPPSKPTEAPKKVEEKKKTH